MLDVSTPKEPNVTYELGVLEELQTVFNPEMAHASYIPFYCLIGKKHLILYHVKNVLSERSKSKLFCKINNIFTLSGTD